MIKTKWGEHLDYSPDLLELVRMILSDVRSKLQEDEERNLYSSRGKLGFIADAVKHMQGQIKHRLKGRS